MSSPLALLALFSLSASAADTPLLDAGTTWRFLDDGVDPGLQWADPLYDDRAWEEGDAELGYGDGDEVTVVDFGADPADKHVTTWFRSRFNVADPTVFEALRWRVVRDDGVRVYLNGVEQFRDNLPSGVVIPGTLANDRITGADESAFQEFLLLPDDLVMGQNVIAVEMHQSNLNSSDLSFDLELAGSDVPILARGPYLNLNTEDAITVKWSTATPSDSLLEVGTTLGMLDIEVLDPTLTTEHEVRITGLDPDTQYHYAIGTSEERLVGDDGDHTFRTSPVNGTSKPSRFWFVGDSGTANANARAVRDAFWGFTGARDPDLFLMLGDNAYNSGTQEEYQRAVFETYPDTLRRIPVWSTLGNHDGYTADSATLTGPYYDIFTFPRAGEAGGVPSGTEAYYSFDYGNVHFVCLDSYESDRMTGGPMLTWLEADLQSTTQDWIIAFWHHPAYSKGSHNSDTEGRMIDMRVHTLPLLEDYGVDLVLSGHSHSYERSFLIDGHYGLSPTFDPRIHGRDMGDGNENGDRAYVKYTEGLAPHEGAVYITAGSSGKLSGGSLDHPAMQFSVRRLGSMVVDVDDLKMDAVFLDETGGEQDRFTIYKGCPPGVEDLDADRVCDDRDNCLDEPNEDQADGDIDGIGDACDDPCDDGDFDGICDVVDLCPNIPDALQLDSDGDGRGDVCDTCDLDAFDDIDNDGICGDVDVCPFAPDPAQMDSDGDGIGNACDVCDDPDADGVCATDDNCRFVANADQADFDGDGQGDLCDPCAEDALDDADGDGLCAEEDNCPFADNPDQLDADGDGIGDECDVCPADPYDDLDGDGVCGDVDNCPFLANADQADGDGDGLGDACDTCADADDDGVCDLADNCPGTVNPQQADSDGDGMGDACDPGCPDADTDTVCDATDNCPDAMNPDQEDEDGDGIGDACDPCPSDDGDDVDGDGVCGDDDVCPDVADPAQIDTDGDGRGDLCDVCPLDPEDDPDGDGNCGAPADTDVPPSGDGPDDDSACGCATNTGLGMGWGALLALFALRRR